MSKANGSIPTIKVLSGYGKALSAVGRDVPAAYRPTSKKTRRGTKKVPMPGFLLFFGVGGAKKKTFDPKPIIF
jgi:hypothetical protein